MNKPQTLNYFWRTATGLEAYAEEAVPDDAQLPYVTYQTLVDSLDYQVSPLATIWERSESWNGSDRVLKKVEDYIGTGVTIKMDEGYMFVCKGSPFAQRRVDPEDRLVHGYLITLQLEFLSN